MSIGFDRLRRMCHEAVAQGVVPGLVAAVGAGGRTLLCEAFGNRQTDPLPLPATPDTVYDLASLTKALVTSLLAMRAVEAGRLSLDEPLREGGPATVRQTLAHAGGFPAHRPFHERAAGRAEVVALAAAEPAEYSPGSRSLYSDVGFILLGDRLERTFGARLDALAARELFAPLGIAATFVDRGAPSPLGDRPVAPTERCRVRGKLIAGEVHDLNAHALDGIAGHAGLFGTAGEVAALAHALCAAFRGAGTEGGRPIVGSEVLRAFWAPAGIPGSTWRLGWDGPAPHGSLAGDRIHRRAVGHLAFTGCSLWIDPERETFVAVLTNRVHPTVRADPRFKALRPALTDAALEGADYRSL